VVQARFDAAIERGLPVGITGGVAVNGTIAGVVGDCVAERGREFLTHRRVPPGDGGLAYGQALVARARQ